MTGVKATGKQGKVLNRPAIDLDDIKNFRQLNSPAWTPRVWRSGGYRDDHRAAGAGH
ncbi:MAG: hypothetical protein R3C56_40310 [Pirellulaceae bacterium]